MDGSRRITMRNRKFLRKMIEQNKVVPESIPPAARSPPNGLSFHVPAGVFADNSSPANEAAQQIMRPNDDTAHLPAPNAQGTSLPMHQSIPVTPNRTKPSAPLAHSTPKEADASEIVSARPDLMERSSTIAYDDSISMQPDHPGECLPGVSMSKTPADVSTPSQTICEELSLAPPLVVHQEPLTTSREPTQRKSTRTRSEPKRLLNEWGKYYGKKKDT